MPAEVRFQIPVEDIVDTILQKIGLQISNTFGPFHVGSRLNMESGTFDFDIEADEANLSVLRQLADKYGNIRVTPLDGSRVGVAFQVPLPEQIFRLVAVIRELPDVIYLLPDQVEEVCRACGLERVA